MTINQEKEIRDELRFYAQTTISGIRYVKDGGSRLDLERAVAGQPCWKEDKQSNDSKLKIFIIADPTLQFRERTEALCLLQRIHDLGHPTYILQDKEIHYVERSVDFEEIDLSKIGVVARGNFVRLAGYPGPADQVTVLDYLNFRNLVLVENLPVKERVYGINLFDARTKNLDYLLSQFGEEAIKKMLPGNYDALINIEQLKEENPWRFLTPDGYSVFITKDSDDFCGSDFLDTDSPELVQKLEGYSIKKIIFCYPPFYWKGFANLVFLKKFITLTGTPYAIEDIPEDQFFKGMTIAKLKVLTSPFGGSEEIGRLEKLTFISKYKVIVSGYNRELWDYLLSYVATNLTGLQEFSIDASILLHLFFGEDDIETDSLRQEKRVNLLNKIRLLRFEESMDLKKTFLC